MANFLMLNPSTADEFKLDPSCTRARNYAARWGFGAVVITNIFGWRATDPEEMKSVRDPVGRGNDRAIVKGAKEARLVVCAWGEHGEHRGRGAQVTEMLRRRGVRLHLLKRNTSGHPAHPLYLPGTLTPAVFRPALPAAATARGRRG